MLQLQRMDKNKLFLSKKVLKTTKKSERATVKKKKKKNFTLIKFQPVLSHQFFLYDIQQQTKKLINPAFMLNLRSLKPDEQLVMNKYDKVAVQSTTTD